MSDSNGTSPEPSPAPTPDFQRALLDAKSSGDFDFVLETAKSSHKMLVNFRDGVANANFKGHQAVDVAQGLNFLENMINQAAGQLEALKRAAKETQAAIKATKDEQPNG